MAKTIESRLLVSLLDGVSGPAKKAGAALDALRNKTKFRSVIGAPLEGASAAAAKLSSRIHNVKERAAELQSAITPAAGASLFGFFEAFQFEKASNEMAALSEATDEQRKKVEDYALSIGEKYQGGATKVLEVINELVKGGMSIDAAMGSVKNIFDVATYAGIDAKEASEYVSAAMHQYNMLRGTVEEASASSKRLADLFAYGSNKSATDVRNIGESFKYAGNMAREAGISQEELMAGLMVMSNFGVKGSEAGVAYRSALVRMLKPTPGMAKELARIGIDIGSFVRKGTEVTGSSIVAGLQAGGIDASAVTDKIDAIVKNSALKGNIGKQTMLITKVIQEALGSTSIVDADSLATQITEALTVAGSKVDLVGFLGEIVKKTGPAALASIVRIFDVRQGARILTMTEGQLKGFIDDLTTNATDYAEKGAAIMNDGVVGAFYRAAASFTHLFIDMGRSGLFETAASVFKAFSDIANSLSESAPGLLKWSGYAMVASLAAWPLSAAGSALAASFGLVGAASRVAFSGVSLLALAPLRGLSAAFSGLAGSVRTATAAMILFGTRGGMAAIGAAALGALNPIRLLRGTVLGLGRALLFVGTRIPVVAALAAAGTFLYQNWQGIGEAFAAFKEAFLGALPPDVAGGFQKLGTYLSDIASALTIGTQQWRAWGAAAGRAAGAVANFMANNAITRGLGLAPSTPAPAPAPALPARAAGGPVSAGQSYLVGERGAEIFTPSRSGSITAHNNIGGRPIQITNNITVQSSGDIASMAREVERHLGRALRRTFDGAYGELGIVLA